MSLDAVAVPTNAPSPAMPEAAPAQPPSIPLYKEVVYHPADLPGYHNKEVRYIVLMDMLPAIKRPDGCFQFKVDDRFIFGCLAANPMIALSTAIRIGQAITEAAGEGADLSHLRYALAVVDRFTGLVVMPEELIRRCTHTARYVPLDICRILLQSVDQKFWPASQLLMGVTPQTALTVGLQSSGWLQPSDDLYPFSSNWDYLRDTIRAYEQNESKPAVLRSAASSVYSNVLRVLPEVIDEVKEETLQAWVLKNRISTQLIGYSKLIDAAFKRFDNTLGDNYLSSLAASIISSGVDFSDLCNIKTLVKNRLREEVRSAMSFGGVSYISSPNFNVKRAAINSLNETIRRLAARYNLPMPTVDIRESDLSNPNLRPDLMRNRP